MEKQQREIRSALFVGNGTVQPHVKGIFAKTNVISRTEAVASATRRGLIQFCFPSLELGMLAWD
jgi:two-component system NarL family response regulator